MFNCQPNHGRLSIGREAEVKTPRGLQFKDLKLHGHQFTISMQQVENVSNYIYLLNRCRGEGGGRG